MMAAKIGVDLNLFELLASGMKPMSTVELAIATCVEPDLLLRLLKFMASLSLIVEVASNLWGPSHATYNLADRNMAAGVNHKYVNFLPATFLPSFGLVLCFRVCTMLM